MAAVVVEDGLKTNQDFSISEVDLPVSRCTVRIAAPTDDDGSMFPDCHVRCPFLGRADWFVTGPPVGLDLFSDARQVCPGVVPHLCPDVRVTQLGCRIAS